MSNQTKSSSNLPLGLTTQTNVSASTSVEFPFNFLHAEIVKHFCERDEEIKKKKLEWAEGVKKSNFADVLEKNDIALNNAIFCQGNAESRLESMGYRVGCVLVERVAKDIPRFTNELETIKFICKEFWTNAFGKVVDNLRTNHKGVYIIQDNKFMTVAAFSDDTQFLKESLIFLALPCGVIRGALACLNIHAIVTSETEKLPCVKFNIQVKKQ